MNAFAPHEPPSRALLHPVWLGSLALLALNDHVFKGAGYLPSDVTGKLSDFAGLMVAPLLLAIVLRVRTRRAWGLAHAAVGMVFAGIQLSRPFADAWSDAMGFVGFPWTITCDPTDLVALPVLLLSAWTYPRVVSASGRRLARRNAEVAAAAGGLACCVATSPADPGTFTPWINADVYVHNDNDYPLVVRVRGLRPEVDFDCDAIARAPAELLDEALFGDATSWTLEPDANMVLLTEQESDQWGWGEGRLERACHAYLLDVDNLPPTVVLWREGQLPVTTVEGTGLDESHPGYISIRHDEGGVAELGAGSNIVFSPGEPLLEPEGSCAPADESRRLTWSSDLPDGHWVLGQVSEGVDGCVELELRTGFEAQEDLEGSTSYVCLPPGVFPFASGDAVHIGLFSDVSSDGTRLVMEQTDAETGMPSQTGATLVASRGERATDVLGATATFTELVDCRAATEPACGTATRAGRITLSGGELSTVELSGAEPMAEVAARNGGTVSVHLVHAQQRLALDPGCAAGPSTLGTDIEVVVVHRRGE